MLRSFTASLGDEQGLDNQDDTMFAKAIRMAQMERENVDLCLDCLATNEPVKSHLGWRV